MSTLSKDLKDFLDKYNIDFSKIHLLLQAAMEAEEAEIAQAQEGFFWFNDERSIPISFDDYKNNHFEYSPGGSHEENAYGFLRLIRYE